MSVFALYPQLLADCQPLGWLPATHLLLHPNAAVPWFILVPETDRANLLNQPGPQRAAVLADCTRISDEWEMFIDQRLALCWSPMTNHRSPSNGR